MKILVSGAAGFIGSHLAESLRKGNNCVMILDNFSTGKMENIADFLESKGKYVQSDIRLREGDISFCPTVEQVFTDFKPEAVIHLAAQAAISTSLENPCRDMEINGIGTLNMLRAAVRHGVKRFVFSSTSAVYREQNTGFFKIKEDAVLEPNTPYGISKLAAEMYVRSMFQNSVVCRFGNVYGPRQCPIGENQVIPRMIRHLMFGDKFYIHGSGNQKRDFVYVTDVVQALVYALYGTPGVYNIATGNSVSVNEIATIVENYFNIQGYHWEHTTTEDPRRRVCLEVGAASHGLGWKPRVSITEGVQETIRWWERFGRA